MGADRARVHAATSHAIHATLTPMSVQGGPRLSIVFALGAAALFGISAPAGKALLAVTDPWLLAGLLYLGSGVSLGAFRLVQRARLGGGAGEAALGRSDWPWLSAAILTGGIVAPVLLRPACRRRRADSATGQQHRDGRE